MLFEKKKGFVQKMLPTILIVRLTVHIIILQVLCIMNTVHYVHYSFNLRLYLHIL